MFDKPVKQPESTLAASKAANLDGYVVHSMPREFYGQEAQLAEAEKPEVKPAPAVVPSPVVKPVVIAPPTVLAPPSAKRSTRGLVVVALVCMLVVAAGAYAATVIVSSVQEQKRLAEEELVRVKEEQEAELARLAAEASAEKDKEQTVSESNAKDTDSDGLTDVEELLYGTNFREPDSDKDSFLDGNEVFHRYHPLGLAPLTLLDTGAVKIFEDTLYPFTMYYPSTWSTVLSEVDMAVTFRSSRQATIKVQLEEKDADESLQAWYDANHSGSEGEMKQILTKEGYYGLTTSDDRTAYLDVGSGVVTLTYDLGSRTQIEYLQTFQMMVNSLTLVESSVSTTGTEASTTP